MSAVAASLAPRSTVRHHHTTSRRPTSRRAASVGVRAVRPVAPLPTRYTVPVSVLPSRSTFVRRRVGAVVFVVALVLSVGSVAQRGLADRGGEPASVVSVGRTTAGPVGAADPVGYTPSYVVRPGDTLWEIAERLYPTADVARIVDALVSLNGSASIEAGQTLNLP
jgi:nucleoid-associated protein YgaU